MTTSLNSEQGSGSRPEVTNNPIQLIEEEISEPHRNAFVVSDDEPAFSHNSMTLTHKETKKITLVKILDSSEESAIQDVLDPLSYRKLLISDDATIDDNTIFELDDVQRVPDSGVTISRKISSSALQYPKQLFQFTNNPLHIRLAILCVTLLVIVSLIASSMLIFLNISHRTSHVNLSKTQPSIRVTPSAAYLDQVVQVHLSNFESSARIRLTRDIAKTVRTDTNTSTLTLGANGMGDVRIFVDESWGSGNHTIEAEDVTTRYTASTELQILNEVPSHPPHLILTSPGMTKSFKGTLDMGSNEQGANTLQSLVLQNSGGGLITWSATSNQPWILTTPQQGIFQDNQSIFIAVNRANLKAGDYTGSVTIVSNGGPPISLDIKMTVLPLIASQIAISPIMQLSLPALSFIGTDGGTNPVPQNLTISNIGSEPLNWSLSMSVLPNSLNHNLSSQVGVNWLLSDETSGSVSPGKNTEIHIKIQTNNVLPSVYFALLTFASGRDTLNAPQVVAISLTLQPGCGIATNQGALSFISSSGQIPIYSKSLSLSVTPGCSNAVTWESFSSASWLNLLPASGQVQVNLNSAVTVQADTTSLQPGSYVGALLLVAQHHSQTIVVQLEVPFSNSPNATVTSTGASTLGISTGALQFNMSQGQGNPRSQSFMITNNGIESLNWLASFDSKAAPWLSLNPTDGSIGLSQSMPVGVSVSSTDLPIGVYTTQITLTGTDSSGNQVQGSPQIIQVTLSIIPGCSFQASPASLAFTVRISKPNSPSQDVFLTIVGSCPRSIFWTTIVNSGNQNWLIVSPTSGTTSSHGSFFVVKAKVRLLFPGKYAGQIVISSRSDAIPMNSLSIPVSLTVIF